MGLSCHGSLSCAGLVPSRGRAPAVSDARECVSSEDDLERSEVGDDVGLVAAAGISKGLLEDFGYVLIGDGSRSSDEDEFGADWISFVVVGLA